MATDLELEFKNSCYLTILFKSYSGNIMITFLKLPLKAIKFLVLSTLSIKKLKPREGKLLASGNKIKNRVKTQVLHYYATVDLYRKMLGHFDLDHTV